MPLLVCGINHQSAPLTVREKLVFTPERTPLALQSLLAEKAVNEALLLSTCNRTEIYTTVDEAATILRWLSKQPQLSGIDLRSFCYARRDIEMVRHVMRVGSGLDSMVLGEPQILGQMKQAYLLARRIGAVGSELGRLFPAVFAATKRIRSETAIGANPVSIAYTVVQLAKRIFSHLNQCQILLIGAGETIELVFSHLYNQGARHFFIANRTLTRAKQIAEPYHAQAIRLSDIPTYLPKVDIVISATMSQLPLVGKGAVESALRQRKRRPLFMADLALPRDIEPETAQLEDVYLYNIDDLQTLIAQNRQTREAAAKQAEAMVEMQAIHYMRQLQVHKAGDTIRRFRERVEMLRDQELEKALAHFQRTNDPKAVIAHFAHNLTNKILHQPTTKLRQAAYEDQVQLLLSAKELFDL
ncbi:glutamyl-tRNA reductase [Coxiella burnetii]|uniref:glutamyl-tRNA reductase n=1 Tax=Coxiella burnetii TaxID=777 RepID=UPI0021767B4B|nr:glutamyl-tRNA reductase [Coxiella burnetii]